MLEIGADKQRRDFRDTSKNYAPPVVPVLEVWKPVQQEVRQLLYMYLTDDSQGSVLDRHQILSVNEVLRDGKSSRDRQRVSRCIENGRLLIRAANVSICRHGCSIGLERHQAN